jgi:hypothetical protein
MAPGWPGSHGKRLTGSGGTDSTSSTSATPPASTTSDRQWWTGPATWAPPTGWPSLGIDSVFSDPDPRLFLDVTVILGRDWPAPEPESNGPMDRLRRWMAPDDPVPVTPARDPGLRPEDAGRLR